MAGPTGRRRPPGRRPSGRGRASGRGHPRGGEDPGRVRGTAACRPARPDLYGHGQLPPGADPAAIATVGIDRVVLGTDFPPAGDSPQAAIDVLDDAGLSDEDKEKILTGNGRTLLEGAVQPA